MSKFKPWLAVATATCALVVATPSTASVVIAGTRIVYPQREREVTVRLTNDGKTPALVQAWIDDGDEKADPATIKVPFTLTPPMFRVDPTRGQSLRLIYTQEPLPTTKESVFWLNVLEVPPRPKNATDVNMVQIAFRTRIKLFFRPTTLAGKPDEAPAKLQWSLGSNATGKVLHVSNPTPFHVSFSAAAVTTVGTTYENHDGGMIDPGASLDISVTRADKPTPLTGNQTNAQPVHFSWINDYGADVPAQAPLASGS
jgi:P pilus assembly chaperone PapD